MGFHGEHASRNRNIVAAFFFVSPLYPGGYASHPTKIRPIFEKGVMRNLSFLFIHLRGGSIVQIGTMCPIGAMDPMGPPVYWFHAAHDSYICDTDPSLSNLKHDFCFFLLTRPLSVIAGRNVVDFAA